MTKQDIGAILLKLRTDAGKTRDEVAELLGKSVKTIGHWETGYAQPDANTLFLLCTIYGADLNAAFGFGSSEKSADSSSKEKSSESALSPSDRSLLDAYHRAPQETKDIVDVALRPYCLPQLEEEAI